MLEQEQSKAARLLQSIARRNFASQMYASLKIASRITAVTTEEIIRWAMVRATHTIVQPHACSRVIQHAWRNHRARVNIGNLQKDLVRKRRYKKLQNAQKKIRMANIFGHSATSAAGGKKRSAKS